MKRIAMAFAAALVAGSAQAATVTDLTPSLGYITSITYNDDFVEAGRGRGNMRHIASNAFDAVDGKFFEIGLNDTVDFHFSPGFISGGTVYEVTFGSRQTWPEFAKRTTIPNPGSKATLYGLGGDRVAMLHNPNPRHRSPLALWVSFDGMKTWPYQRVLVPESCDGPKGRLNYPDGFVSEDGKRLHFAFDDNRHRAVYVGARLPVLQADSELPKKE